MKKNNTDEIDPIDTRVVDVDYTNTSTEVSNVKNKPLDERFNAMAKTFGAFQGLTIENFDRVINLLEDVLNNSRILIGQTGGLPMQSEKQDELRKALAKATSECKVPNKGMTNSHQKYDYASLDNLLDACFDALKNNKIGINYHQIKGPEGEPMMFIEVTHWDSGEYRNSTVPVYPTKDIDRSKALAGGFTSAKRLFLSNLLGLGGNDE